MFSIIGIIVVFGAVIGGFLMEKGPMLVLMQPSEFLIIGGCLLYTSFIYTSTILVEESDDDMFQTSSSKVARETGCPALRIMTSRIANSLGVRSMRRPFRSTRR